jgi:hypothetical protein
MNSVWQKSRDFPKIVVHEFHLRKSYCLLTGIFYRPATNTHKLVHIFRYVLLKPAKRLDNLDNGEPIFSISSGVIIVQCEKLQRSLNDGYG